MGTDVREWVEGQRAALAKRAYQFVEDDDKIKEALAQMDPNPLRVVLGAAASASCLDEVILLLRYQHARAQDKQNKWPLELVTGIEKQLRGAIDEARTKPGKPADFDAVEAMLAAVWLGFVVQLHRYLYEKRKTASRAAGNAPAQGQPPRGQPPRGREQRR